MSIPTFDQGIQWIAGGAQGNAPALYDGEEYLCAVRVRNSRTGTESWEFAVVTVVVDDSDEEPTADLFVGDEIWGWGWESVDWYVPIAKLQPPELRNEQGTTP